MAKDKNKAETPEHTESSDVDESEPALESTSIKEYVFYELLTYAM